MVKEEIFSEFNGNQPLDVNSLEALGLPMAIGYIDFLKYFNGGEGFIGPSSYIILWRAEELVELNQAYEVEKYAKGLFLFGSDGGGEAYAFDTRSIPVRIVQVPFVGMDLGITLPVAESFDEFLMKLFMVKD